MTWLAVLAFPHASVAVHVRVTVDWPAHEPGVVTSTNPRRGFGSHRSVADAVAKLGVAGHSIVLGSGSAANTGAVWSTIVIDWLAVLALPHPSVAVHVRVTTDSFGQRPGAWASLNVSVTAPPQSSLAEGDENTGEAGHSTLDGSPTPELTGACVSRTWTDIARHGATTGAAGRVRDVERERERAVTEMARPHGHRATVRGALDGAAGHGPVVRAHAGGSAVGAVAVRADEGLARELHDRGRVDGEREAAGHRALAIRDRDLEREALAAADRLAHVHLDRGTGGAADERGAGAVGGERPHVVDAGFVRGLAERLHRSGAGGGRTREVAAQYRVRGERAVLVSDRGVVERGHAAVVGRAVDRRGGVARAPVGLARDVTTKGDHDARRVRGERDLHPALRSRGGEVAEVAVGVVHVAGAGHRAVIGPQFLLGGRQRVEARERLAREDRDRHRDPEVRRPGERAGEALERVHDLGRVGRQELRK